MEKLQSTNVLDKLNSDELKEVLKGLKLYSDLTKKLGNRGKKLFSNMLSGDKFYKVEYTSALSKETAWKEAQEAFKKAFGVVPEEKKVSFIVNDNILGGIKVFLDDEMLDLSLTKIFEQIK